MGQTYHEKLLKAEEMLQTIEDTLAKLYKKTATSTSFGDQSLTLQSIKDLEESRQKWKFEISQLKSSINKNRQTLKIHFR